MGNVSDTSYCRKKGKFYLTLNTDQTWTVTVKNLY